MLFRWPIKYKLWLCIFMLLLIVGVLAFSSLQGGYAYSELAKTISWRAEEVPLAEELSRSIHDAYYSLSASDIEDRGAIKPANSGLEGSRIRQRFSTELMVVEEAVRKYRKQLDLELPQFGSLGDRSKDRETLESISLTLEELKLLKDDLDWVLEPLHVEGVSAKVRRMQEQADELPKQLNQRMLSLSSEVRVQYKTWIYLSWTTTFAAGLVLLVLLRLFYVWVVAPLHVLIDGSRRIAKNDDFAYRIHLATHDEMGELADSMNDMTARFLEIKSDQEEKIRQRTQEVVRSEQLASVGFLAAGVAHEINNPLASIALCAESLESRVHDIIDAEEGKPGGEQNSEIAVLKKYLRRIQDEAFRCKGITDRLLDFSRLGDVHKQETNLGDLLEGVIDMVRHLGDYREKQVVFRCEQYVKAPVNAQEIKQVALNLITNALDSLDAGGVVEVALRRVGGVAEIVVSDNGCGMTTEVLKHLFEPFFTRRRNGQGTGLGLSITYRIVQEHGGQIEPSSAGPGQGSTMRVTLPLIAAEKGQHERENQKRLEAA